jgi:predicted Zn-ribbon and HTH transcriptional regulator
MSRLPFDAMRPCVACGYAGESEGSGLRGGDGAVGGGDGGSITIAAGAHVYLQPLPPVPSAAMEYDEIDGEGYLHRICNRCNYTWEEDCLPVDGVSTHTPPLGVMSPMCECGNLLVAGELLCKHCKDMEDAADIAAIEERAYEPTELIEDVKSRLDRYGSTFVLIPTACTKCTYAFGLDDLSYHLRRGTDLTSADYCWGCSGFDALLSSVTRAHATQAQ